jgi:hypothetical protein
MRCPSETGVTNLPRRGTEATVTRALAALGALGLVLLAAGCGGTGAQTHATVAGQQITQQQVDALVSRAREEALNERQDFPERGSEVYRELQQQALAMLVYRAQVETAAKRLGIAVTDTQARNSLGLQPPRHKDAPELVFEHAIGAVGLEEGKDEEGPLRIADARLALTLKALERKLGRDGVQPWIERTRRSVPVRYA